MWSFERAALYAAEAGIDRVTLEEALRSGELPSGVLPQGGWVIESGELQAWIDRVVASR